MNLILRQIGSLMIAFASLYAVYDFVTFFTEKSYNVDVTQCAESYEYEVSPMMGAPSTQVKVVRFKGNYKFEGNFFAVDVHQKLKEFGVCDAHAERKVWISKFSPAEGRLHGSTKDWGQRLGLSLMLFAFGWIFYLANKSKLCP